ncbi:MAG: redoxin domain-containing protein, partial [Verrucomicrobiota bacterium]
MIRAEGYLPASSPVFPPNGWHQYDFELHKGDGLEAVVQRSDGKPAVGAYVATPEAGYLVLTRTNLQTHSSPAEWITRTDDRGRFKLPALIPSPSVVVAHEQGFASASSEQLRGNPVLRLMPWGRVEGVIKAGSRVWANEEVLLVPERIGPGSVNYDFYAYTLRSDPQGKFAVDRLIPGRAQLVRLIPMKDGGWMHSHAFPFTVKTGEVTHVTFGGVGRPVVARFVLSDRARQVDWNSSERRFATVLPTPPKQYKTQEEWKAWNSSPQMKAARRSHRYYGFIIQPDGTMRMENILPGTYELSVTISEPKDESGNFGPAIGSIKREVVIPQSPEAFSDEPVDLGELVVNVRADLKPGDPAPELEGRTFEDKPVKLSDFRGKLVLLDFRTVWPIAYRAQLPQLKQIAEALRTRDAFALVTVSLDQNKAEAEEFSKKHDMTWTQIYAGPWSETPIPIDSEFSKCRHGFSSAPTEKF